MFGGFLTEFHAMSSVAPAFSARASLLIGAAPGRLRRGGAGESKQCTDRGRDKWFLLTFHLSAPIWNAKIAESVSRHTCQAGDGVRLLCARTLVKDFFVNLEFA